MQSQTTKPSPVLPKLFLLFFINLMGLQALAQEIFVDPQSVGQAWASADNALMPMFRGNPTRTFYGEGELADTYAPTWRYPERAMCSTDKDGKSWCGSGWTGQPALWRRPDGILEIVVGTYDRKVHFINFATGEATRKPFPTGDIIKGSVSLDPDGFPLVYFGSRDNKLRILSLAGEEAEELWSLDAKEKVPYTIWNNDWDSNPLIINDYLLIGGENGWFYVWKLNRDQRGSQVSVAPELRMLLQGWTDELVRKVGRNVSIESSVAVFEDKAFFANSGGRVVGVDLSAPTTDLTPQIIFDFWLGDDIDATLFFDQEGYLYASIEAERFNQRSEEMGQLVKLDTSQPEDPVVWSLDVRRNPESRQVDGLWATPALGKGVIYVTTHRGLLLTVDQASGEVLSSLEVGNHAWSSPLVLGERLLVGTCSPGGLKIYDVADPTSPMELSHTLTQGCIESTPLVWEGEIVVGSRDGFIYKFSPN